MKIEETQVVLRKLVADDGKIFARKTDGEALGPVLWLGRYDSAENYREIDEPQPEGEEETQ